MIFSEMKSSNMKNNTFLSVSYYVFIIAFSTLNACYATPNQQASKGNIINTKNSNHSMSEALTPTKQFTEFEILVATKMALDIRYFCLEAPLTKAGLTKQCLQPVTILPQALADMVSATGLGSVVLFAENLESTKQIIQLNHDLQQAALKSPSGKPLIISIDQEGGRVVRLPHATSFAGNMAIGATYLEHGVSFATKTSTVIAKELAALGFNNNYAPVLDVNTNPDNPVINTRSYGENPQQVAELGVAAVNGFQQHGIMATLKHFPGHGDTHVDSHLGLPVVAHDLATIKKKDLAPFQWAIDHSDPAMIMTAHIQYPALDDSTIVNNAGEKIVRPATMSRKILADLLRTKMGFDGIIATDALDMAGIAHYFDEVTAVVETFIAGADLAVMPYKIRKTEDIEQFYQFIKDVARRLQQKIDNKELLPTELTQSIERINHYKEEYCQLPETSVTQQIEFAEQLIAKPEYLKLEQSLIDNAIVQLTPKVNILPVSGTDIHRIHLFVLDWQEFGALKNAIINQWQSAGLKVPEVSATVVAQGDTQSQLQSGEKLAKADLVIATVNTKVASAVSSAVDTGGAEDLLTHVMAMTKAEDKVDYKLLLSYQLQQAQKQNIPSVLIAKGSPYLLHPYRDLASTILINFDDHIYDEVAGNSMKAARYSSGYVASMAIIFGEKQVKGKLPVSL